MKKIIFTVLLALAAVSAQAQFTIGTQFGIYYDNGTANDISSGSSVRNGSAFNYSIKPTIGYYFTPGLVAGLKFNYTNCSYSEGESGFSNGNIKSYLINVLMGNGLERNYQSWKLSPYLRYRVFTVFQDKVGLWVELDGYYGIHTPRENGKLDKNNSKTIFGAELHPLISYDILDKYMIYTSLDILSLSWDASVDRSAINSSDSSSLRSNSFVFQCNPLVAVAHAFFNIGIMRKF